MKRSTLVAAALVVLICGVVISQTVITRRAFDSRGLPIGIGYGTALPTVANNNRAPVDGEFFAVKATGTTDPRLKMYADTTGDWIDVNTVKYNVIREDFTFAKVAAHVEEDFTAAVVTDASENMIILANSPIGPIHYRLEAPGGPGLAATVDPFHAGEFQLDTLVDDADNEGVNLTFGGDPNGLGFSFDESQGNIVYCEAKFSIADISDTDSVYFGWTITGAYVDAGAHDGFDTSAIFVVNDNAGDLDIETELNGGGTLNDDTGVTWADAASHVLRVTMAADTVTFTLDGTDVTQTNAVLNADDNDEFHCSMGSLNAAAGDPQVAIDYIEIGVGHSGITTQ